MSIKNFYSLILRNKNYNPWRLTKYLIGTSAIKSQNVENNENVKETHFGFKTIKEEEKEEKG